MRFWRKCSVLEVRSVNWSIRSYISALTALVGVHKDPNYQIGEKWRSVDYFPTSNMIVGHAENNSGTSPKIRGFDLQAKMFEFTKYIGPNLGKWGLT